MHPFVDTPNDIESFSDLIRRALPQIIERGTEGAIFQMGDEELVAWTAAGQAAWQIELSNGAIFQFTVQQTAQASMFCASCDEPFAEDELDDEGRCPTCADPDPYVPSESPYDCYSPRRHAS